MQSLVCVDGGEDRDVRKLFAELGRNSGPGDSIAISGMLLESLAGVDSDFADKKRSDAMDTLGLNGALEPAHREELLRGLAASFAGVFTEEAHIARRRMAPRVSVENPGGEFVYRAGVYGMVSPSDMVRSVNNRTVAAVMKHGV
jgi:hypothetical protein